MKQFTLEYWEDEGWYVGRLVEIPGIFSQGETLEKLKENIEDAYKMIFPQRDGRLSRFPLSRNLIKNSESLRTL